MRHRTIYILIILIFFFISNCKTIMQPVQDLRETNKYTRLNQSAILCQPIENVKKDFTGITLLLAGKCEKLEVSISESPDVHPLLSKVFNNYTGNIRKTTYIKFDKKLVRFKKKLWLNLKCRGGNLLIGYKINSKYTDKNFTFNNTTGDGILYYRSVYETPLNRLISQIIKNAVKDISFIILYLILICLLIFQYFLNNNSFIYKKIFPSRILGLQHFNRFKSILITGLLLRMIVVPFFIHVDMLSGLWVPYMMFFHNPIYYATDPDASFHLINQLFHLPIMMFSKIIFKDLYNLWENIPYTYNLISVYRFSQLNSVNLILLLNKIPYLLTDILFFFLLLKVSCKIDNLKKGLYLWAFNPISLYVVYMIGRFELYAILFILAGLLLFDSNKKIYACLAFGIAAAFRQYPILFFPIILIAISENYKDIIKYSFFLIIPLLLYNFLHNIPAHYFHIAVKAPTSVVSNDQHSNMLFYYKLNNLTLFPLFYFLLLFIMFKNKKSIPENIYIFIFAFFNVLFAFTSLEPQYFMWITPFLILAYIRNHVSIKEIIIFFILYFGIVLQWDKAFSTQLAMPLLPDLFYYLPSPERIINEIYPVAVLNRIITSCFAALNIYWFFKILKRSDII